MHKKLLLSFITLLAFIQFSSAQDPHFSQFYANPLYLNPALAGSIVCPRVNLNYRNQWPSILGTFVTYNVSYDQHIDNLNGGVGVLVNTDRAGAGTLNTTNFSGIYSYKLDINEKVAVKAALQATYFQRSLDWDKLTFPDQLDPKYGFVYNTNEPLPENLKRSFADFSSGIVVYSDVIFAGFAAHHITRPNEGFNSYTRMPIRYTGHFGATIGLEGMRGRKKGIEETSISPNIMFMKQQDFEQINYGLYFNKYPFVGGAWFRQNLNNPDALILLIGVQQQAFKFGYSYDLTVSTLTNASGGAHEFSLTFLFPCREKQPKARPINCPTF